MTCDYCKKIPSVYCHHCKESKKKTCCSNFKKWKQEGRSKGYYFHVMQEVLEVIREDIVKGKLTLDDLTKSTPSAGPDRQKTAE